MFPRNVFLRRFGDLCFCLWKTPALNDKMRCFAHKFSIISLDCIIRLCYNINVCVLNFSGRRRNAFFGDSARLQR